MAPNPALKILPAVWLLWGISALWSQEVTGPVVVTREDLTVDVFSQTSSYENPIKITTYCWLPEGPLPPNIRSIFNFRAVRLLFKTPKEG